MKQFFKHILTIVALLLSTSAWAQDSGDKFTYVYQLDGEASTAAAGTVLGTISGTTATLTVNPADGNYITKDQITVIKTVLGNKAQGRTRTTPDISAPVEITATDASADPSGVTTYTFDASDENYSYEVTANFLSRINIADATVTLTQESYPYTGGAIEPEVTVTLAGAALTADKDYTVDYDNNTDVPATANDLQPTVTVTGKGVYKGSKSVTFTIYYEGYDLWIGDTQVTDGNKEDILDQANNEEAPLYIYNPKLHTLIINGDQTETTVIQSSLPELKVYLMDISKIKCIFFDNKGNTSNTGKLTFTCNGNFPGTITIDNKDDESSAISGFSEINYEYELIVIEPDGAYYEGGKMMKEVKDDDGSVIGHEVACVVTIGQITTPIMGKEDIKKEEQANLENFSTGKILITLKPDPENPDNGDCFDDEAGDVSGIAILSVMTDEKAAIVAEQVDNDELVPGGSSYAEDYDGLTFMVPAGEGKIEIDQIVDEGYEFHLRIGTGTLFTLREGETGRVKAEVPFDVDVPTYCYLYLVEKVGSTGARGITPIGKRDTHHGKVISITVNVTNAQEANPPSEASGGVIKEDPVVTGIQEISITDNNHVGNDRWYNLNGQQIEEPTKQGLYIYNRKKIFIK
jgi:hypothetical protein